MSTERVIFGNIIESLFVKALARDISPELRARLKALGLDLDARLLPAYPHAVWVQCLNETGRTLYPDLPLDEARQRLAQRLIEGYAETMVGRAVLAMARLLGPMRTLSRMTYNFRSGNNFTETRLTVVDATTADLWFNEPEETEGFIDGVLKEGMKHAGVLDLVLTRMRHGPDSCTYRVQWNISTSS